MFPINLILRGRFSFSELTPLLVFLFDSHHHRILFKILTGRTFSRNKMAIKLSVFSSLMSNYSFNNNFCQKIIIYLESLYNKFYFDKCMFPINLILRGRFSFSELTPLLVFLFDSHHHRIFCSTFCDTLDFRYKKKTCPVKLD
jgi:hypothetical protein